MNNTEYPIAVEIKSSEDLNIDFQQYWFAFKRRWLSATVIAGTKQWPILLLPQNPVRPVWGSAL